MTKPIDAERSPWVVFLVFLKLGLTSFGGPVAHLAYFHDEFVVRRHWLSERNYADLVALCQFLPGPASSQVGMAIGVSRAGYWGACAAWAGFTLPSAVAMVIFALGMVTHGDAIPAEWLDGFKAVAVAVVAQAVWGMGRHQCTDAWRASIMAIAASCALLLPSAWGQVLIIGIAGLAGLWAIKPAATAGHDPLPISVGPRAGLAWLTLFGLLLAALPIVAVSTGSHTLQLLDAFYRAGALVFGGGHVVLPLLQAQVVPPGWVDNETFLAGYGLAQAVPGPLFSFAAFLGAAMNQAPTAWAGGVLCLVALFAPAFLLVVGALPFWEALRRSVSAQAALAGINAAVLGLLLAALYQPVWTSTIHRPQDFVLSLLAFVALTFWKIPPWLVVLGGGAAAWGLNYAV